MFTPPARKKDEYCGEYLQKSCCTLNVICLPLQPGTLCLSEITAVCDMISNCGKRKDLYCLHQVAEHRYFGVFQVPVNCPKAFMTISSEARVSCMV